MATFYKQCIGCGNMFGASRKNQTRCHPGCGQEERLHKRFGDQREFIAVDGEGVTDPDGSHRYVLLSVGDKSLHVSPEEADTNRLRFSEIMTFLWEQYTENPNATFVGFYLSYDMSQWFRDLPEERARMLFTEWGRTKRKPRSEYRPVPFPVRYDGWEFDLLGLRRLKLRPEGHKGPWLYICDAGPFWQTSLLNALNPKNWQGEQPILTDAEYEVIKEGKKHRSDAKFDPSMIRYNVTENLSFARAMERLQKGFAENGWMLKRTQWFGPGQAAQLWLNMIDAPKAEVIRNATPDSVLWAALSSYYGGWFEIPCHGHVPGLSYEYDINSAYPAEISELPCLLHGKWKHGRKVPSDTRYCLVRCTVTGDNPYLGPLPHRNRHGIISRPNNTQGWYWAKEIDAAQRAGLVSGVTVHETWTYNPCPCRPPFRAIKALYEQRLRIGKNTSAGKALKLVYNSAYGKFAQSVGNPKYSNAVYASLITSGCRVRILDAIATHPEGAAGTLMVATDGVYFRSPHPKLEISGDTLGLWDEGTKQNLTLFMPGVYWDDKSREDLDTETPRIKSRGINAVELANNIRRIDDMFSSFDGLIWPEVTIPVRFSVVSPLLALARNDWASCGTIRTYEHHETTKDLSSNPSNKRMPVAEQDGGLWRTSPYVDFGESTPYSKSFGMDLQNMFDNDSLITDDGTINRELLEMLGWT